MALRCSPDSTRGIVGKSADVIRGNFHINQLDNWNELTLGLCSSVCLTFLIWVFAMPAFSVAGISWVQAWESLHPSFSHVPITLQDFNRRVNKEYKTPMAAFRAMDADRDEFVGLQGFIDVVSRLEKPLTTLQAHYAFKGLDENDDGLLESMEFENSLKFQTFFHKNRQAIAAELRAVKKAHEKVRTYKVQPHAVELLMTVEHLDHALLRANEALSKMFNRTLREAIVKAADPTGHFGVNTDEVQLNLLQGPDSTLVDAVVGLPVSFDARHVQLSLNHSAKVEEIVTRALNGVPEVVLVATQHTISISRVSRPAIIDSGRPFYITAAANNHTEVSTTTLRNGAPLPTPPPVRRVPEKEEIYVQISVSSADLGRNLSAIERRNIAGTVVRDLAYLAKVPNTMVRTTEGTPGKVEVSEGHAGRGLVVKALLKVSPDQERPADLALVLRSVATKQYLANELSKLDGVGTLEAGQISIVARTGAEEVSPTTTTAATTAAATTAEATATKATATKAAASTNAAASTTQPPTTSSMPLEHIDMVDFEERLEARYGSLEGSVEACDQTSDSSLDLSEFVHCLARLSPPIAKDEAKWAFGGLDMDQNGAVESWEMLTVVELGHFYPKTDEILAKRKETTRQPITMEDFKSRQVGILTEGRRLTNTVDGDSDAVSEFAKADANGDGYLSKDEFKLAMAKRNPPLNAEQEELAFAGFDTNKDDKVSEAEFVQPEDAPAAHHATTAAPSTAPTAPTVTPQAITVAAFKQRMGDVLVEDAFLMFDENQDGFIEFPEFLGSIHRFQPPLNDGEAVYAFKGFDVDKDTKVSFTEFSAVLTLGTFNPTPQQMTSVQAQGAAAVGAFPTPVPTPVPTPAPAPQKLTVGQFRERMQTALPRDTFSAIDTNHDQVLDQVELDHGKGLFKPPLSEDEIAFVTAGLDANKDGKVSASEFFGTLKIGSWNQTPQALQAVESMPMPPLRQSENTLEAETMPTGEFVERMKTSHASPQAAFDSMDQDHDALLSYLEFAAGCAAFQVPLDDNEAGHVFQGFDANKDGHISRDEFFGVLKIGEFYQTPEVIAHMKLEDYDCNADLGAESSWTAGKKSWCCAHGGFGCSTTPPPPDALTIQDLLERLRVQDKSPEAAFRLLDEDGDSFVSPAEFEDGARACEPQLTPSQTSYAFKGLDANYDGKVSLVEFTRAVKMGHFFSTLAVGSGGGVTTTQWVATKDPMTEKVFVARLSDTYSSHQDAFRAMRGELDGRCLTRGDFEKGTADFKEPLLKDEADYAFTGFDVNGDDQICWEEFEGVLKIGKFFQTPEALKKIGIEVPEVVGTEAPSMLSGQEVETKTTPAPKEAADKRITMAVFQDRLRSSYESPNEAYHGMDINGDGTVDLNEFINSMQAVQTPLSKAESVYLFRGFDVDQDSKMSRDEFLGTIKLGALFQTAEALEGAGFVLPSHKKLQAVPSATVTVTTTTKAFELAEPPIALKAFRERMGLALHDPNSVFHTLGSGQGGCLSVEVFKEGTQAFGKPLTSEEADYAFCGFDTNYDRKVCSDEFFPVLQAGHFFPSEDELKAVRESKTDTKGNVLGGPAVGLRGARLSDTSLKQYAGVPAVVDGHAEIELSPAEGKALPEGSDEIGRIIKPIFTDTVNKAWGVEVEVEDVTVVPSMLSSDSRTALLLWTVSASDGGAVQMKMRDTANEVTASIQAQMRDLKLDWFDAASMNIWAKAIFRFYGPAAASLPDGIKLEEVIGKKAGGPPVGEYATSS